jgi:hypothetical protein
MGYDKWDTVRFYDKLEAWNRAVDPPPDVFAAVKSWVDSRQDAPRGDAWPTGGDEEGAEYRAFVRDLYRRPVICHGRPVTCTYLVDEDDHKLVCLRFSDET